MGFFSFKVSERRWRNFGGDCEQGTPQRNQQGRIS